MKSFQIKVWRKCLFIYVVFIKKAIFALKMNEWIILNNDAKRNISIFSK